PKHKGWIHVKSTGSLPPEGVRIGDESARQLATFITNAIPGARLSIANVPAACSPGALMWTINAPGMGLLVCENQGKSDPQTITEATYGGSEPVVIVVPGHGYRTGNIVRVTGTGVGVDNQNWRITVLDENRFVLEGSRGRGNF